MRRVTRALALGLVAVFGLSAPAQADDFYKGKVLRLIVGSGEASGVDILGRVAARHLANHIPGRPTIIVQNMAAPKSIAAANYVYNVAEPDGLTIGAGSSGLFSRAISQPNIRFDLSKFTWVANIYSATVVFWMRTDFPCQTFEALSRCPQTLKFGATARGSTGYGLVPELLKDVFKLNMDMIYGYRNVEIALERGEVHASGGDLIGFMGGRPRQLMEEGKVEDSSAGGRPPRCRARKAQRALVDGGHSGGAQEAVPHGQSDPRPGAALFRAAGNPRRPCEESCRTPFAALANDPAFRADVKQVARIEPSLVRGPEMDAAIKEMLSQPKEVSDRIIGLLRGN